MLVLKFGGSSVATAEKIKNVVSIVLNYAENESRLVTIVSAFGGVTDELLDIGEMAAQRNSAYEDKLTALRKRHATVIDELGLSADETVRQYLDEKTNNLANLLKGIFLIREFSNRTKDFVSSYGEVMSSFIIAAYIKTIQEKTTHLDSRLLIKTNDQFCNAKVDVEQTYKLLKEGTADDGLYVMGGFIASNERKETTTLGRGGSDYTAALVAAGTNCKELHIWTDVNGVMSADPRKVKKAFSIPALTYDEAMELSHFGAKVIYPPTIKPVLGKKIPVRIKNTFNPDYEGTLITDRDSHSEKVVKGLSSISNVALIRLQGTGMIGVAGISGRLFSTLAVNSINVILISQASSEHSICFAVKPDDAELAVDVINKTFSVEINAGDIEPAIHEMEKSILAVVGASMNQTTGIAGRLFQSLGKNGVNIDAIAQGSSELNISLVIDRVDENKALNIMHDAMFLSRLKSLNLFIVGTGLIGSTLIEQIRDQSAHLHDKLNLDIRIIGITNSRKMVVSQEGMTFETALDFMNVENETADLDAFVEQMIKMNLPNSIFVDNTASEIPIAHYKRILGESISIVTPNKIAKTSSYQLYNEYLNVAERSGAKFLYETNVGAGLPIISTLKDLTQSGDEIVKIEAVLSGSLSFIFNTYTADQQFKDVVELAGEKGYTEPDPRIDLSGKDVARKVLILAREVGYPIELEDIEIEQILPDSCMAAPDVPAFFEELKKHESHFNKMISEAEAENKKIRIIGMVENGKGSVSLQMVGSDNPFYNLSGSDNMVVFTTRRYQERPLVVKGPGAGAAVTAAGVFAEIISIGKYLG